jgi:hypothetical protein
VVGAILTKAELQELTGARQRAKVIRVLVENDIRFVKAADGWPRVHSDALTGHNVVSLSARRSREPNLDAFA